MAEIKVYSLREESRDAFAREVAEKYGITVRAVDTPQECVRDVDIILSALLLCFRCLPPWGP